MEKNLRKHTSLCPIQVSPSKTKGQFGLELLQWGWRKEDRLGYILKTEPTELSNDLDMRGQGKA